MARTCGSSDHTVATVARFVLGAAAIAVGVLVIRSIPDLIRYVRMERI